jgi:hypothetical protein
MLIETGFFMAVYAAEARRERVSSLTEAYMALGQQHFDKIQIPYNPKMF